MKKRTDVLCPLVFFCFVFVVALVLLLGPKNDYSQREKRYLKADIQVSGEALLDGKTQGDLESWIEDQFPGRDFFVGVNAYWNLLTGRNVQQDIYFCSDGYLINGPATQDLTMFETSLKRFDEFASNCGVPASLVLVPSTGWLQEDRLPKDHDTYPDERMMELAKASTDSLRVLDLWNALAMADAEGDVAYRTDHHLTSFGCYTLYAAMREAQGKEFLSMDAYKVETIDGFRGTTWSGSGYWLNEADTLEIWDAGMDVTVTITDGGEEPEISESLFYRSHLEELDMYPVFLDGNHCQVDIVNPNGEGTLLILKDSYGHCAAPFLAEHYETIIMLDLRYYRGSVSQMIAERQVDEVLFLYGTSTLLTDSNSAWLF